VTSHVNTQHTDNPERFECTVEGCEMTFPSMSNMTRHVKKVHEGERPYATWEGCDNVSKLDRSEQYRLCTSWN
jgi:hypothetical protein